MRWKIGECATMVHALIPTIAHQARIRDNKKVNCS